MSTETAAPIVNAGRASTQAALKENLRDYGLFLALIAIMVFFQFMTGGILFLPVNLTNVVLQNSYIIVMALGMLLVFKGLLLALLGGRSVGPFPTEFQMLSAGFIPDIIGPMTIIAPALNASGNPI